jgi:hypothetical protein
VARTPIVTSTQFEGGTFLLHGPYGAGKTNLIGDMLATEAGEGPVRFINLKGEDGYLSIMPEIVGMAEGETAAEYDDLLAALGDAKKAGVRAIGIDGFHRLYSFVYRKLFGSDRMPSIGGQRNEWGDAHKLAGDLMDMLRYYAPIVVVSSASDKSMDQLRGETHTTPNFPGQMAAGVGGRFDFVFYLDSEVIGPSKIKRTLRTAPVSKMVVRYRLPRPLPPSIELPDGKGGWTLIVDAINKAMGPVPPPPLVAATAPAKMYPTTKPDLNALPGAKK